MSHPVVTMIVVSWNVRDALRRCLTAADQSRGYTPRIIVIDNNSQDGSADMVAQEFPNVTLIRNNTNRGFAAAVNQGLAHRTGHVLLLNPDVEMQPDTVETLIGWFHRLPHVGIAGPKLQYMDGTIQPSVKQFPRWHDLALVLSKLPNIFPRLGHAYHQVNFDYSKTQEVDQVMGSCYLIRSEVLDQIGLFDEKFWIWYEEVDFCLRAGQAGWKTLYVSEAHATHGRGQSFAQVSTRQKQAHLRRSIQYYVQKHFGALARIMLVPFSLMSILAAWLIDVARLRKPIAAKEF